MPLNVGDATLTFFGDTSQLDQVFARLPAQTEAAMSAATGSVGQLGDAVGGVNFELDATAQNVPYCGEVIKEAMGTAENSTREAKGEVMLLKDLFGVTMPRHVASFIASLPGVGAALSAAFAATAVLFLVDVVVQLVEKIQAFAEEGEKIKEVMEGWDEAQRKTFAGLEDGAIRAKAQLAELTGDHLEALKLKLQLIDNQTLDKLAGELDKLKTEADKVMAALDRNWFEKLFLGMQGSDEAQTKLKELQKTVSSALNERTPQAYGDALKVLQTEFDTTTKKLQALDDQQQQHEKDLKTALGPRAKITEAPDEKEILAWDQLGKQIRAYIGDIQEAKKAADDQKKAATTGEAQKQAEQEAARQKQLLDQQITAIDTERDKAKLAFDQKKISAAEWAAAEQKSVTDTMAAHKHYGETVVDIYKRAGESLKAQTAAQAANLQSARDADQVVKDLDKSTLALADANRQFQKISSDIWKDTLKDMEKVSDEVKIMEAKDPFLPWQRNALRLNAELKNLGVQGFMSMQQHLDAANKAENALNLAGIKEGKLWLQVQAAKLKAIIAIDQAEGKSADKEIRDLHKIEGELDKYDRRIKDEEKHLTSWKQLFKSALDDITAGFGTAIAAWIAGEKSLGDALKEAASEYLKALSQKAMQEALWDTAKGFVALATGDMEGASQYFEAAAIMAAIGVGAGFGARATGGGGGGKGAGSNNANIDTSKPGNQAAPVPTGGQNIPHLFTGAIVTRPQIAMVGDNGMGGSATEGIFRLDDPRAMQAARRLLGGGGGDTIHNWNIQGLLSTQDLVKTTRIINRGTETGRLRVNVSRSGRVIKKG